MPVIPNNWTKKEKPVKVKPKNTESTYVPTLAKANMQRTLRGTRK